jgi:hypothetical protein
MKTNRGTNLVVFLLLALTFSCSTESVTISPSKNDLQFNKLASTWDEAIPLGNGMLGALVWQKGDNLRISLDRADLWDLRPMDNLSKPEFSWKWVQEHNN